LGVPEDAAHVRRPRPPESEAGRTLPHRLLSPLLPGCFLASLSTQASSLLDADALAASIAGASDDAGDHLLRAGAAVNWLAASYEGAAGPDLGSPSADALAALPGPILAAAVPAFAGLDLADAVDMAVSLVAGAEGGGTGVLLALAVALRARPDAAPGLGAVAAGRGVSGPASLLSPATAPVLAWALAQPALAAIAGTFVPDRAAALRGAVAAFLPGLVGQPARLAPAAAAAGVALLECLLAQPVSAKAGALVAAATADTVARACLAPGVGGAGDLHPPPPSSAAALPSRRRASSTAPACRSLPPPSPPLPAPFAHPSVRARLQALRPSLRALGVAGVPAADWVPPALAQAAASARVLPAPDGGALAVAAAEDAMAALTADPECGVGALRALAAGPQAVATARLVAALATSNGGGLLDAEAAPALARLGEELAGGGPPTHTRPKAATAALTAAGAALAARARGRSAAAAAAVLARTAAAAEAAAAAPPPAKPARAAANSHSTYTNKKVRGTSLVVAAAWAALLAATLAVRFSGGWRLVGPTLASLPGVADVSAAVRHFFATLAQPSALAARNAEEARMRALAAAAEMLP